jgi:cation transporter-like permease
MKAVRKSYIFTVLMVAIAASLSLLGGIGIESVSEEIVLLTPLVIAIPSLANLVGDYAAVIAAHAGDPTEHRRSRTKLLKSLLVVLSVSVAGLVILALLLSVFRGYELSFDFALRFASFIFVSSVLVVLSMFLLAGALEVLLRHRRINPDEVLVPVVTSLADIFMLTMIAVAVKTIF